jgi:TonB family protein
LTGRIPDDLTLKRGALLLGAACVAFLICAAPSAAQTSGSSTATVQASAQQQPSAGAAISSYPDSPEGLQDLIKQMLTLQKSGDVKALAPYVQSLILPNPTSWFTATFGEKLGTPMSSEYDRTQMNLPLPLPDTLSQIEAKHMSNVQAHLFTDSCDVEAGDSGYSLLVSRTQGQPLFDVRFSSHTDTAILAYFAYVDGAFRYISNFRVSNPTILRVGGNVMRKKEVEALAPRYPEQAKMSHISGTVIFHAIIGPNGHVCSLQVVQGPPELIGASFNAVRQWRYSPTTLNGQPVSIDTTISIVFALSE